MGRIRTLALLLAFLGAACGAEPEGGLLEIRAALDASVVDPALQNYRTYRVQVSQLGDEQTPLDELREVDRIGPPPDVFVVRSPIAVTSPEDGTVAVWVRLMDYASTPPEVLACAMKPSVVVLDGAITPVEVTLASEDCP